MYILYCETFDNSKFFKYVLQACDHTCICIIPVFLYHVIYVPVDPIMYPTEQPSKDVDEKANAYFQAIYNRGMSVNQLLEILKQFKDSPNKKEKVFINKLYTAKYNVVM